jgi:hypothetical protein
MAARSVSVLISMMEEGEAEVSVLTTQSRVSLMITLALRRLTEQLQCMYNSLTGVNVSRLPVLAVMIILQTHATVCNQ